ncbi:hypothetical protein ISO70_15010 [Morganella morganii subsp. morganii]|uniref:hypothetical protein n=1 Tax=Morganella morganii TaxID=582 RepID=UPI001BDB2D55|nr:hypothetical protein [Morganella morganii]MBT0353948.1 hypothetical protein [Morganella morganii subsp. morganii]HDS6400773.1 hypothetical protein [Morganella morganii subsp. morganii]
MMNFDHIILCESPLQIKNSFSYIEKSNTSIKPLFLVRLNNNSKNNEMMFKILIDKDKENPVKFIKTNKKISLLWLKILSFYLTLRCKNIIIGDFRSKWMFHRELFFIYKNKNLIFIDDGLATINIKRKLETLNTNNNITLFTTFNISSSCLNIINHNPRIISNLKKNNSILFIGSPLVDKNIMSYNNYIAILKNVLDNNTSSEIIYCKHRAEVIMTDADLVGLGFTSVYTPEIDLESSLEDGVLTCSRVIGLYSTALVTISNTFPDLNVIALYPGKCSFNSDVSNIINDVYKYFYFNSTIKINRVYL